MQTQLYARSLYPTTSSTYPIEGNVVIINVSTDTALWFNANESWKMKLSEVDFYSLQEVLDFYRFGLCSQREALLEIQRMQNATHPATESFLKSCELTTP